MMKKFFRKQLLSLSLVIAMMVALPFSVSATNLEDTTTNDIDFTPISEIAEIEHESLESLSLDSHEMSLNDNIPIARNALRTVSFNPQGGTWPAVTGFSASTGSLSRSMNQTAVNYNQVMNTNNRDILAGLGTQGPGRLAPARVGFAFAGWFTAATGGTRVNHNTAVTPGATSITLHAQWIAGTTRITWNANGGSISPGTQYGVPGTPIATLPTPTRAGRQFIGWFTTATVTGGTRITTNTTVPTANITYHARWSDPDRHNYFPGHSRRWMPPTSPHTTITFRFVNGDLTWLAAMRRGRDSWNNSNVPVTFSENSASNNLATVLQSDGTYLGRIVVWGPSNQFGPTATRFEIEMNLRTIAGRVNYIESVFAHELGHAIGLRDNPVGIAINGSLMNHARNRNIVIGPANFDLESVNILYR